MKILLFAFALILNSNLVWAAACCGSSVTFPSLITTEEPLKFSVSINSSRTIGDAPTRGIPIFREEKDQNTRQSISVASAMRFEQSQYSVAGSYYDQNGGSGDLSLGYAHDFASETDVFTGFPNAYGLMQITAPTGRSIYELDTNEIDTVTGKGLWSLSTGAHFLGRRYKLDYSVSPMMTAHQTRSFDEKTVSQDLSGSLTIGSGYSITGKYRVGAALSSVYGGAKTIRETSRAETKSRSSLVWPVTLQFSTFPTMKWGWTLAYTDETLVGPVRNTTLSRSISVSTLFRNF